MRTSDAVHTNLYIFYVVELHTILSPVLVFIFYFTDNIVDKKKVKTIKPVDYYVMRIVFVYV